MSSTELHRELKSAAATPNGNKHASLAFNTLCQIHHEVSPIDKTLLSLSFEQQQRLIVQLQEQTLALQNELAERQQIEQSLRVRETDLKSARKALEEAHRTDHFRCLAEALPQLVWTVSSEGKIEYSNQHWSAYTGTSTAASCDFSWITAVDGDDKQRVSVEWQNAVAEQRIFSTEHRIIRASDGQSRWHLSRAAPIQNEQGDIVRWFGTSTDIHEQKQLQEELIRAKDAAENANQAKSAFLANMSHEIRTPLAAVLGFSNLLRKDHLTQKDKDKFVESMARNGRELVCLIDDILDLSKVEAGRLDIEKIKISLANLLADVTTSLGVKAREKGLSLTVETDAAVPDIILSDPTRLRQILLNIIGNGIKFTEVGGVFIRTSLLCPQAGEETYKICFAVKDTGRGITEEEQERLFKPFSQADHSTTRRFGGTGLGLVLSRRLAKLLGGELVLSESQPGISSVFTLTIDIGNELTLAELAAQNGEDPSSGCASNQVMATSCSLQGFNILLVDDAPDNRFLVESVLHGYGAKVDLAEDGLAAISLAMGANYDMILMDIQMPILDGYEATRRLRQMGYSRPIIALSAYAMRDDKKACFQAGCNEHLSKPLDYGQLIETVIRFGRRAEPC